MEITSLRPSDIPAISRVLRAYWKERNMDYTDAWTKDYLRKGHSIEQTQDVHFVLKEGKHVVGYLSLIVDVSKLGELRDFVIVPAYRGKNYGEYLLLHVIDHARSLGLRKLMALVFPSTVPFYQKYGFRVEGLLKDHFIYGENLAVLGFLFPHQKKDQQINLRETLADIRQVQDIAKETSDRLLKMKSKPQKSSSEKV